MTIYDLGLWEPNLGKLNITLWQNRLYQNILTFKLRCDFPRSPGFNLGNIDPIVMGWHQDCGGYKQWIIIWSNILPTRVREKESLREIELFEGHIYMFHNHLYEHKAREEISGNKQRYFARAYVWGNEGEDLPLLSTLPVFHQP